MYRSPGNVDPVTYSNTNAAPVEQQIQVPPELQGYLKNGKPIIMGRPISAEGTQPGQRTKEKSMYICRVPSTNISKALTPPVTLCHRTNWEEDTDDTGNAITTKGERVLEIEDSRKVLWTGKRDAGTSKSTNFVLFDRGTHWELFPVVGSFTFITDMSKFVGNQEADEVERQQRIRMARELAAEAAITNRFGRDAEGGDASGKRSRAEMDSTFDSGPANITQQKKARLQKIIKKKRAAKDLDIGNTASSSLAVGEVRKAEHDWDFDDGGVATDDEGQDVMSDHEAVEEDVEDIEDSEEEKEDVVLTNYGESLNRMLQHQKEVEADEELAQFSDDEDDEEKKQQAADARKPVTVAGRPDSAGPTAAKNTATMGDTTEGLERQKIIDLLKQNNNQITVKSLLEVLGVTAKNSKFHLLKKLIAELADVKSETVNGQQVRFFALKEEFRG
eukprot:Blabericola_migrator_1__3555@NODE_2055_length_3352_cov_62_771994_g1303_i0_p1_GENE_NODE_2055_length_3352_cov_62_771994_g1303_i0NODE_2055_length_3352_cov_62_771994_g1303_i0_p1_ORF_typecomplete_len446_score103_44TFIIF_alpha/PF05793_12/3_8e08HTH_11/PF08279_12/0_007HTH_DeoR/PF08220_12/0_087HTH_Mga/PF08280_11/0_26BSP_II/PF05432_11/7_1_NODE_2055_length_3352_cov_62_771994_g1303_i05551892